MSSMQNQRTARAASTAKARTEPAVAQRVAPPMTRGAAAPKPTAGALVVMEAEAARMLSVSMRHLQRLRAEGEGPPIVNLGPRRIGYILADVEAWLAGRRVVAS